MQLPVLPQLSVAEQLTGLTPFGKAKPLGGTQVTTAIAPSHASFAVGAKFTTAVQRPGSVLTGPMLAQPASTGATVSFTMIACEQELWLPLPSVAVQVRQMICFVWQ